MGDTGNGRDQSMTGGARDRTIQSFPKEENFLLGEFKIVERGERIHLTDFTREFRILI